MPGVSGSASLGSDLERSLFSFFFKSPDSLLTSFESFLSPSTSEDDGESPSQRSISMQRQPCFSTSLSESRHRHVSKSYTQLTIELDVIRRYVSVLCEVAGGSGCTYTNPRSTLTRADFQRGLQFRQTSLRKHSSLRVGRDLQVLWLLEM